MHKSGKFPILTLVKWDKLQRWTHAIPGELNALLVECDNSCQEYPWFHVIYHFLQKQYEDETFLLEWNTRFIK